MMLKGKIQVLFQQMMKIAEYDPEEEESRFYSVSSSRQCKLLTHLPQIPFLATNTQ